MFHPVSLTCYTSASRRLKPFSHLQPDCLIPALECVEAELQTVRYDCEDPEKFINQAEEFLSDTIQGLKNGGKIEVSVPDRPGETRTGRRG